MFFGKIFGKTEELEKEIIKTKRWCYELQGEIRALSNAILNPDEPIYAHGNLLTDHIVFYHGLALHLDIENSELPNGLILSGVEKSGVHEDILKISFRLIACATLKVYIYLYDILNKSWKLLEVKKVDDDED